MSKQDKIIEFIIPAFNEEKSIRHVINHIRSHDIPYETSIVVTDGGSTDNTISICKEENVRVIHRKNLGKGSGMREAGDQSNADILVFIDSDNTYKIDDMNEFLKPLLTNDADMVIGSRLLGSREKGSITSFNLLGNKMFNKTINFALKSKLTDSQSACRACTKKMFSEIFLISDSYDIEVELTTEAIANGYVVVEHPINYFNRVGSKPKLNPLKDGYRIAKTLFFIIMNFKPLQFFALASLIVFVISLYPSILVIYEKIIFGDIIHIPAVILSAVLIMTSILLMVLGILSELIVSSRRRLESLISKEFSKEQ